jgi:hypothetical protein
MIARRKKWARLAVAGGASLALLGGCAQAPPIYQAAPPGFFEQQQPAYGEPQYRYQPDDAPPVTQAAPQRGRRHDKPPDDGPVISDNPSAPTPAPVPEAPADNDCPPGSWWDLCHVL